MDSARIAGCIGAARAEAGERLYESCAAQFGPALERLAAAYQADADMQQDLLQEIQVAVWRSLRRFDQRCSLRTWVYKVAHNTAASYVARSIRRRSRDWVSLEEVELFQGKENAEETIGRGLAMERLMRQIQRLRPADKQVMLLYLEGLDASGIAEVTGISPGCAATRIHRVKAFLARQFQPARQVQKERRNYAAG